MADTRRRAVILTALQVEYEAVKRHLKGLTEDPHPSGMVYERGVFEAQGQSWDVCIHEIGAGNANAVIETERIIAHFKPNVAFFVGVAGGIKDVDLGDVVVATKIYGYESGKAEETFKARPEVGESTYSMIERAKFERRKNDWMERLGALPDTKPRVLVGPVAAGEKVVASTKSAVYQFLHSNYGDVLAVEMEGRGFLEATRAYRDVEALVVRGISDLLDDRSVADSKGFQEVASQRAAAFAFQVLAKLNVRQGVDLSRSVNDQRPNEIPSLSTLPPQEYFVGRTKELETIADALSPDARGWGAVIEGPGGVGKTALAINSAYRAPVKRFPIKIFLSAKMWELTPSGEQALKDFMLSNYDEILAELARQLDKEEIGKGSQNDRTYAVRSALARSQALIVIDNVETLEQKEVDRLYQFLRFLPGSCKAIVTSRRHTNIEARVVPLGRLELKEALDLMSELSKTNYLLARASDTERRALYESTNGNPLFIKWVVGQLGVRGSRCRSIADGYTFLKNAPKDNDPLEFVFGDVVGTFTETEMEAVAALAHCTQAMRAEWIAEIADLPVTSAQTALEDLADRAVITTDEKLDSFILLTLAATFLRRIRPEAVARAGARLTARAYALAMESLHSNSDGFKNLEARWPTIAAALPLFVQGGGSRLQDMCAGLHRFLSYSGRWDELLALNIQAEQKAKAEGNFYSAGFRAYHQGGIYRVRYQPANVLASAERAQKYWSQAAAAGKREEAMVTELRGWGYRQQDNYQMAIEAFRKTLDLDRTIAAESADVVIDLQALAEAERAAGEYDLAEHDHTEALRIARKLNDVEQVATSAVFLTEFSVRRGEWKAAEKKALNALTLSQGLGRQESIATAGAYLALALANQGRRAEALPHILQAVKIYRRLGGPNLQWAEILLRDCEGGVPAKSLPPDSDRVTPLRPDSSSTRTAAEDDKKRN